MSDGFVLDTPKQIGAGRLLANLSLLTLEARGIRKRHVSALQNLRREGFTDKATAKGALKQIALMVVEQESPLANGPIHKGMIRALVDLDVKMTKREKEMLGL